MQIHIALYRWKVGTAESQVQQVLADVRSLAGKVEGIIDITAGANSSKYGEGYTHAILVRGNDQQAIDAYRSHPDHQAVARVIDDMEERGVGVDFAT